MPTARASSERLLILQHEFIHRDLRTKHSCVARILGMAQEVGFRRKLEPGRLDLPAKRAFLDTCSVFATDVPSPARAEWSAITRKPPGFSAANIFLFICARSTGM